MQARLQHRLPMGDFSGEWLALREPADVAARSRRLTRGIADALAHNNLVHVLDLATGTGSNVRYLADQLPVQQSWLLADHDPVLLAQVPMRMCSWGVARGYEAISEAGGLLLRGERLTCRLATRHLDLTAIDDAGIFAGRSLVTASALLDLVSDVWLRTLAARCRKSGAAVLFALTYDGRIRCSPDEPEDGAIRELVNRHQLNNKGFGAALGSGATARAEQCFAGLGYQVRRAPSDWVLSPDARELQRQIVEGWAWAAAAIAPDRASFIRSWRTRRLAHVADNRSRLVVGHEDLAAWLPSITFPARTLRARAR